MALTSFEHLLAAGNVAGKRVLIRQDLNVPLSNGEIANDKRIRASLPTIRQALDAGAAVLVMSHLGRPIEGQFDAALSLAPVARYLAERLDRPVELHADWLDGVSVEPGGLAVCENVRFNVGEKADDETLARRMAGLCDIFVMDAFGTAHRAQASTHGVACFAPVACAGPLLCAELDALGRALREPARPLLAIVGGSKVSTKLGVLESLASKVDQLIVGGGIANTVIAAAGHSVGTSLYEPEQLKEARALLDTANIPLPVDVVCGAEFSPKAQAQTKPVDTVGTEDMILDIGPRTAGRYAELIRAAGTVIWNGPVGVFEFDQFGVGTRDVARAVADSDAFSIAGGGDTVAAIDKYGLADDISYISTGGGAFLEYVQGKTLPAVAMLERRATQAGE